MRGLLLGIVRTVGGPLVQRTALQSALALTVTTGAGYGTEYRDMSAFTYRATSKQCPERTGEIWGTVIHHDDVIAKPRTAREMVRLIESYGLSHEKKFGCGPSYHYIVWSDGDIWKLNDPRIRTSHAPGANEHFMALVLNGKLNEEPMPEIQRLRTIDLVYFSREMYGGDKLYPHKRFKATACPGKYTIKEFAHLWSE